MTISYNLYINYITHLSVLLHKINRYSNKIYLYSALYEITQNNVHEYDKIPLKEKLILAKYTERTLNSEATTN